MALSGPERSRAWCAGGGGVGRYGAAMTGRQCWAERVAADDVETAAAVWADPAAPAAVLARCPDRVLEFLATEHTALRRRVLAHPAVPDAVKAAIARRAVGSVRKSLVIDLARCAAPPRQWLLLSPAFTPVSLADAVRAISAYRRMASGSAGSDLPAADPDPLAVAVRKAFTLSAQPAQPAQRALTAEGFALGSGPRHRWTHSEVSATRLLRDPSPLVRRGLARNPGIGRLVEDHDGLSIRQGLLTDPDPTVRAAAIRSGVHVTRQDLRRAVNRGLGLPDEDGLVVPVLIVADPLDDPDPRVRAAAVGTSIHPAATERWARVAADPSPVVRAAAATRGWSTPAPVWRQLARDPDDRVRTAVARSRWVNPRILRMMTGDTTARIAAIAQQRVTTPPQH